MSSYDPMRDARRRAKKDMANGYFWFVGIAIFLAIHHSDNLGLILLIDIPLGIFIFWKIAPRMKGWKEDMKALDLADKIVKDMSVLDDPEFREEFEKLDRAHQALVIREVKRHIKV